MENTIQLGIGSITLYIDLDVLNLPIIQSSKMLASSIQSLCSKLKEEIQFQNAWQDTQLQLAMIKVALKFLDDDTALFMAVELHDQPFN
jgi:hypothetical protein